MLFIQFRLVFSTSGPTMNKADKLLTSSGMHTILSFAYLVFAEGLLVILVNFPDSGESNIVVAPVDLTFW